MSKYAELMQKAREATAGQWQRNRHGAVVGGPIQQFHNGTGMDQLAMCTNAEWMRPGEKIANENFIASANPATVIALIEERDEMLGALKELLFKAENFHAANVRFTDFESAQLTMSKAQAVIAKCEGTK